MTSIHPAELETICGGFTASPEQVGTFMQCMARANAKRVLIRPSTWSKPTVEQCANQLQAAVKLNPSDHVDF